MAALLLQKGADIQSEGYNQSSVLHGAVGKGHLHMTLFLIDNGASLQAVDWVCHHHIFTSYLFIYLFFVSCYVYVNYSIVKLRYI